ncbi:AbrB/MazE/SpoVT family DNA-binding domain-containing protein [Cyanothece sp. BG0011]|uniref:AbrB/MazE/SpoVT family DNA-binding domain-containing protein n=1 Tax=Cyanothece sp. BG0011 TaxID=2082950 RepID=UPI000D1D9702|nr:AbrB/MazE/SpoVT family DNA-binding domain-containing protein [Cyanothece sp. BG0011]
MQPLTIRKFGDSLGITLHQEILKKLNLSEGDNLYIKETADGLQITSDDPEFDEAMTLYRQGSSQYDNALRELA